jgi:hypothetical protein
MSKEKPNPFTLIKHAGDPNRATFEGITVERQEKLFIYEWGGFVGCAPYDEHFIFEIPQVRKRPGLSEYLCTCGSAAIVIHPESPQKRLFCCQFEALYGLHQTSVINKDDFEDIAEETLDPERSRKWLI